MRSGEDSMTEQYMAQGPGVTCQNVSLVIEYA